MDDQKTNSTLNDEILELAKKHAYIAEISVEELVEAITKALTIVGDSLKNIAKELEEFMTEIDFDIIYTIERKKEWRQRKKFIEDMYCTKLKCFEQKRPFGRVYKPP